VSGVGERFSGYAVLGVAFASGDVLALRRFPMSSRGPAYTSVWHRSPAGLWTLYTDVADHGCARHLGPAVDEIVVAPIRIEWTGARRLVVTIDSGRRLTWSLLTESTTISRLLSAAAPLVIPVLCRHPRLDWITSVILGLLLRTGPLHLVGRLPSGARFIGQPWRLWRVRASRACIDGHDTGPDCPLVERLSLGEVTIPRRPLFAATDLTVLPRRDLDEIRARSARPISSTVPLDGSRESSQ
jgi:hypothetical protein